MAVKTTAVTHTCGHTVAHSTRLLAGGTARAAANACTACAPNPVIADPFGCFASEG